MEVGTQTLPSFPFSLHANVDSDFSLSFNRDSELAISDFSNSDTGADAHELTNSELLPVALNQLEKSVSNVKSATEVDGVEVETSETTAAVKVQKVYRSYRTRRRLADSAVVAEELWWQAIDFAQLSHTTVSFFNFSETPVSRWNRISSNASKVGKGLSKDCKAQKLAFQHWIEAIDPRHRYGHSLHLYYEVWMNADAGQPFFYWLDIGDGRGVDLEACPRSKLRQQCITYLGPQQREHHEYVVCEGKIVHKLSGELLDTTKGGSPGAKWIFVMSTLKNLYAGEKKKGIFHHSSFLAGGATLAAGRLGAVDGVLKSISAYSGHYRPTDDNLNGLLDFLREKGVNIHEVEIRSSTDDYEYNGDSKLNPGEIYEVPSEPIELSNTKPPPLEIPGKVQKYQSSELDEATMYGCRTPYKRTLSGSLPSPRSEVPKKELLQRINSKKMASSYQLGHQLSLKWSTGAGPRIGCVADYPLELRIQAMELVDLSPRNPPTPSSRFSLVSPTSHC